MIVFCFILEIEKGIHIFSIYELSQCATNLISRFIHFFCLFVYLCKEDVIKKFQSFLNQTFAGHFVASGVFIVTICKSDVTYYRMNY